MLNATDAADTEWYFGLEFGVKLGCLMLSPRRLPMELYTQSKRYSLHLADSAGSKPRATPMGYVW
jgi:hypothetical protein